jgi:hypothetical protein
MMLGSIRMMFGALVITIAGALSLVSAAGQTGPDAPPQMSDQVFKNIQVLKGIPVDEFMDTMGMFASALGYDCASCHAPGISSDRNQFAVATPSIQRARTMVVMMNAINKANFRGEPRVTCFTCHRGHYRPEVVPNLALQYGELTDDPNAMLISLDRRTAADDVFAKYVRALGGADRLAAVASYVARGTYAGFNTGGAAVPVEIFAKAPNQLAQIVRLPSGDSVKAFDGRSGWVAEGWRPMPLMALTGGNLAGVRADVMAAFPATIQKAFSQWQVGGATIDEKSVVVLQGTNAGELPVNFYFDESGLLVRQVRWNRTVVGTVPTQVDYSDYREVAGVKLPFHIVATWTGGQTTTDLKEVQPNVPIDAARFARPAPFQRR